MIHITRQVIWTNVILDEFIRLGGLTKEEEMVMRTRCAGWTITKQSLEFHMSKSKVDSLIKSCKHKYDLVEPYSTILPKRKNNAKELYMDTH